MSGSQPPNPDFGRGSDPYAIFEQTPDAIFFIKNAELQFESANYTFARLCGAQYPKDLHGYTSRSFFSSEIAEMYERWDSRLLSSGLTMLSRFHQTKSLRKTTRWIFGTRMLRANPVDGRPNIVNHARLMPTFRNSDRIYARLEIATNQLASRLTRPPSINELADISGCSASQLNRDFIRFLGISPLAYRTELQIQRAKDLIKARMKLADIALECGFFDQSGFSRCFKKSVGITPSEFADNCHNC